jgi:hypothetical protein
MISDSRSDANVCGFFLQDSQGMYCTNCTAYGNTSNGWNIGTAGTNVMQYGFFVNCIGDTSGSDNWLITQLFVGTFSSCWGSAQISQLLNTSSACFNINSYNVSDLTFQGCLALANNSHGFLINNGARISLNGCISGSTYKPGVANGKSGTGSGVYIGSPSERISISDLISNGNPSYGIEIANGVTQSSVIGGELRYNVLGAVSCLANTINADIYFDAVQGYTPLLNNVTTPAIPASTVGVKNTTGFDCDIYITGGTVTNISLDGSFLFNSTPSHIRLPFGAIITMTYSVAPSWKWIAN